MGERALYPGWIVLAAVFTSAMLVIGGSIYCYQLFVIPVTTELGISRGSASNAYVALLVGLAVWSPLAGRMFDRASARTLIGAGGIAYGAGMVALSQLSSPVWMLVAVFVLLGLGMTIAGGLAANTVTARWFEKRRGRALGIASIASSAGGFVMIPITTGLIETQGWRTALLVNGCVIALVIVLLALFVVRDRPEAAFIEASDEFAADKEVDNAPVPQWTFAKLLTSKAFWMITAAVGLLLASDQAVLTSQFPFFIDIGLSEGEAATIITTMTGSAIAGKMLVGFLAERYDIRWLYALVALFHAGLLGVFLLQPGFWPMLAFVALFGAAVGGIYPVWSVLVSQHFELASFGVAFGAMALFTQVLAIGFVAYVNRTFDASNSYEPAYAWFLLAIAAGMLAIVFVGPARKQAAE